MAYNEELADRVREQLGHVKKVTEQHMFGGVSFQVAGNMACGVQADELIVRVGPDLHHDALTRPGAHEMEFTGRSMKGIVAVGPDGWTEERDLEMWVKLGVAYALSLPPKAKKAVKKKKAAATKKAAAAKRKKAAPVKKKRAAVKKKAAAKKRR